MPPQCTSMCVLSSHWLSPLCVLALLIAVCAPSFFVELFVILSHVLLEDGQPSGVCNKVDVVKVKCLPYALLTLCLPLCC